MIRRGRREGWLDNPIEELPAWAEFHGVTFNGVRIGPMPGLEDRGSTVIAKRDVSSDEEGPLMVIPRELFLSHQNIDLFAKSDLHLKEVIEATGEFGCVCVCNYMLTLTFLIEGNRVLAVPFSSFFLYKQQYVVQISKISECSIL